MEAVKDTNEVHVEVRTAGKPHNPLQEINSPHFLKALQAGAPATERAFRYLVIHMQAPLNRYVGRWLRDSESIQDVLQETFLAVHRGLPCFEGKSSLTTWVYSLAYHKAMDRLEEYYRPGGRNSAEAICTDREDSHPLPDEAAHKGLLIERIRAVAECIPDLYFAVWRLRDLEGQSGKEAAQALGLTSALVQVRLHRARVQILARLHKEQPELVRELVHEGRYPAPVLPGRCFKSARFRDFTCAPRCNGKQLSERLY
ncbi:MAG: RNA polymerase sigma factor [Fibrobacteria bacterium]